MPKPERLWTPRPQHHSPPRRVPRRRWMPCSMEEMSGHATGYMAVDFFMDQLSPASASSTSPQWVPRVRLAQHHHDLQRHDSGGECGVATQTMLPMPEPATTNKPWWSYVTWESSTSWDSARAQIHRVFEQYEWLEKDLARRPHQDALIILNGHRAMYISSTFNTSQYTWRTAACRQP